MIRCCRAENIALLLSLTSAAVSGSQQSPSGSPLRLIRSTSGSKGHEQGGVFAIEDPRTQFHYPNDEQVIVQFEWEGEPGPHHFEGRWKNPTGKAVVISEFEYVAAGRRFGGYWTLKLGNAMTTGLWALEALVDGEVAGMHAFQLSAEAISADAVGPKRLTPAEIYALASPAVVLIEKLDSGGQSLETGSGFVVDHDRVLTAFQVIDGAKAARVLFPDRTNRPAQGVLAWDRNANWAFLSVPTGDIEPLSAASDSVAIGDRVYTLDAPDMMSRVIRDGAVVGRQSYPRVGERLRIDIFMDPRGTGTPVFDEHGRVIAIVTRNDLIPGMASLSKLLLWPGDVPHERAMGFFAVPVGTTLGGQAGESLKTFDELWAARQFMATLSPSEHLTEGSLGTEIDRTDKRRPRVVGEGFRIPRKAGSLAVSLRWTPLSKFSSELLVQVFDEENRPVLATKSEKIKLGAYQEGLTVWELDVSALPSSTYRVDALLSGLTVWRSFFELVD